jgi:hypothetical protein
MTTLPRANWTESTLSRRYFSNIHPITSCYLYRHSQVRCAATISTLGPYFDILIAKFRLVYFRELTISLKFHGCHQTSLAVLPWQMFSSRLIRYLLVELMHTGSSTLLFQVVFPPHILRLNFSVRVADLPRMFHVFLISPHLIFYPANGLKNTLPLTPFCVMAESRSLVSRQYMAPK